MVRCILQNRTGTHFAMCKPMALLLNWWSLHHHIKRKEEHNNMLLLPDIVLFCSYVIAPSKYNVQITLFSSLSLCAEIVIHLCLHAGYMAHKKQYFRIRCLASFAIMKQGGTPTHIVPFGHFGFTAKYKCIPYQNDTDNFFSWIPHDQICGICHCLSNVPQLRDGQTYILVFPCGSCR